MEVSNAWDGSACDGQDAWARVVSREGAAEGCRTAASSWRQYGRPYCCPSRSASCCASWLTTVARSSWPPGSPSGMCPTWWTPTTRWNDPVLPTMLPPCSARPRSLVNTRLSKVWRKAMHPGDHKVEGSVAKRHAFTSGVLSWLVFC